MAALVATARAICLDCALDRHGDGDRARPRPRAAFLTPIAKAFGTDTGCRVSALATRSSAAWAINRRRAILPGRPGHYHDLRGDERHPGDGPRRPQARRRRRRGPRAPRRGRGDARGCARRRPRPGSATPPTGCSPCRRSTVPPAPSPTSAPSRWCSAAIISRRPPLPTRPRPARRLPRRPPAAAGRGPRRRPPAGSALLYARVRNVAQGLQRIRSAEP